MIAASTSVPVQVLIFVAIGGVVANGISSLASAVMAYVNLRRLDQQLDQQRELTKTIARKVGLTDEEIQ